MWRDRRILDLLRIEHPIILAPMAGACSAELTAAVSEAGGLGSFGGAGTPPDRLRNIVQAIRQRTDRPFNMNLFSSRAENFDAGQVPGPKLAERLESYHAELGIGDVPAPKAIFGPVEEQTEMLIEEGVPIISYHYGADPHLVDKAHEAGAIVLCSATTTAEAKELEALGIDAIIAQGGEAGGHRGTFTVDYSRALIGTMALVPQVVDAVSVPVIAAGGIMDARGMVAALALGASAVQMGTAFLGCTEAPVDDVSRAALSEAEANDVAVTLAISGKAARGLRNRYVEEVESLGEALPPYPAHYSLSRDLRNAAVEQGNADFITMWSGQGVGLFRELPAAELVAGLVAESQRLMESLAGD